jgi:hypothetical protein
MSTVIDDAPASGPEPEGAGRDNSVIGASGTVGRYVVITMALASIVAAGVHFAFAPVHFGEDWQHGWFFLFMAWFQLAWAGLIIFRPRRWVLAAGVVANLGIVVLWAVTRTSGLPFGPGSGQVEAVGVPDVLCTVLESVIVLGSAAYLVSPATMARPLKARGPATAVVSLLGLAAVLMASLSLTPAWAGEHAHHDSGAGGHVHTALQPFATGTSPCEQTGPPAAPEQVASTEGGHNHRGPQLQQPIDEKTRLALEAQQTEARAVAAQYPTAADAMKAGYHLSVVYVPCIGAHYTNVAYAGKFDPAHPSELLYDGSTPSSKIVGLSYLVYHPGGAPPGFVGPNDHWHQHTFNGGLCLNNAGVVVGGEELNPTQCQARGGHKQALKDIWMLHNWVVPGWECSWGVFAPECPELGGRTGGSAFDSPRSG